MKFYNGTETIGGPSMEFSDGTNRVIYGFGKCARNLHFTFPDNFKQLIIEKYAPVIDGVYKKEFIDELQGVVPIKTYDEVGMRTAIFITHGHNDHMALIEFLDPRVELYVHEDAYKIFAALWCADRCSISTQPGKNLSFFKPDVPINIGPFQVTPIFVDHNTISPCSLKIDFDGIQIAYTGDYYLAGKHLDRMEDYIQKVKGIDVLISEGTELSFINENELVLPNATHSFETPEPSKEPNTLTYNNSIKKFKDSMYSNFINGWIPDYSNIEYAMDLYDHCKNNGINLVVLPKMAYALSQFGINDVPVLFTQDSSTLYEALQLDNEKLSFDDLDTIPFLCIEINLDVTTNICNRGKKPIKVFKCAYISPDLTEVINEFDIDLFDLSIMGHASVPNLIYTINQINPKQLMAIHSFKPELLLELFPDKALASRKHYTYVVEDGKLVCKDEFYGKGYLVSSDLDGTLFIDNMLDDRDLQAIIDFKSANPNNLFMMNTGRTLISLLSVLKDFSSNVDYFSCANGALIYDKNQKLIEKTPISNDELEVVFKILSKLSFAGKSMFSILFQDSEKNYYNPSMEIVNNLLNELESGTLEPIYAIFVKIHACDISNEYFTLLENTLEVESHLLYSEKENENIFELLFTTSGVHKGWALDYIQSKEGKNTTTHIGDFFNDIGGFKYADRPFLVGTQDVAEGFRRVFRERDAIKILQQWR